MGSSQNKHRGLTHSVFPFKVSRLRAPVRWTLKLQFRNREERIVPSELTRTQHATPRAIYAGEFVDTFFNQSNLPRESMGQDIAFRRLHIAMTHEGIVRLI